MHLSDLKGKVALVTGAGSGVGKKVVEMLLKNEAHVVACDIKAVTMEVNSANFLALSVDISNPAQVEHAFAQVDHHFGKLDIVVHCAAIFDIGGIEEIDEQHLNRMIDINIKGSFYICKESFRFMKKVGKAGSIINIASTAGEYGSIRAASHYAASKGAVIAMSKSLAREGASYGIRVNCVSPGPLDTPMNDIQDDQQRMKIAERTLLGRVGTPDDIANAALYLASDVSSWVTGEVIRVNGGSLL
jgi:NAD(P)-dependent dehydrogenase (short-subunit alcohol dehydrogenase family)